MDYHRKKRTKDKKSYRSVPKLPPVIVGPFDGNGEDESNKSNLNNNPKVPYDIFPLTGNKYPRILKGLCTKKFLNYQILTSSHSYNHKDRAKRAFISLKKRLLTQSLL